MLWFVLRGQKTNFKYFKELSPFSPTYPQLFSSYPQNLDKVPFYKGQVVVSL